MNIALKKIMADGPEYYIACVKKNGAYTVYGKYVTASSGTIRIQSKDGPYDTEEQAARRCRDLARMKVRKKGFKEVPLDEIPEAVVPHLEMPTDMQVTPEELLAFLRGAKTERYVVFKDVGGLEDYFDLGVEYLAHTTKDDDYLLVFDRYGESRECFAERMESIEATEDAKKAEGITKL